MKKLNLKSLLALVLALSMLLGGVAALADEKIEGKTDDQGNYTADLGEINGKELGTGLGLMVVDPDEEKADDELVEISADGKTVEPLPPVSDKSITLTADGIQEQGKTSVVGINDFAYNYNGDIAIEVDGDVTATAKEPKGDASAMGIYVDTDGGKVTIEAEDVTAQATGSYQSEATAIRTNHDMNGATTITVDSAKATATTTDSKGYATATAIDGYADAAGTVGTTDILVDGDVYAKAKSESTAIEAGAKNGGKLTVTVLGDATAKGGDGTGIEAMVSEDSEANVLVDGTVSGSSVAIKTYGTWDYSRTYTNDAENNSQSKTTYATPNIYVWSAEENKGGRIAEVYDVVEEEVVEREWVVEKDEDGNVVEEYPDDNVISSSTTWTLNEEASAKLEAAIWYIVKVKEKWQSALTATGTGTYTANETTYQVAHQDDTVTLNLTLPANKKLAAIMYNDGKKADFVQNADGTYSVKMLRGGEMMLSLKLAGTKKAAEKSSASEDAEATAKAESDEATKAAVNPEAHPAMAEALADVADGLDGEGATVDIVDKELLMNEDELARFDKLSVKDRMLVAMSLLGCGDGGMSDDAKALVDDVNERVNGLSDDEKAERQDAIDAAFQPRKTTVDGEERDSVGIGLEIDRKGDKTTETYTFYDDEGAWKLCSIG